MGVHSIDLLGAHELDDLEDALRHRQRILGSLLLTVMALSEELDDAASYDLREAAMDAAEYASYFSRDVEEALAETRERQPRGTQPRRL